MAIKNKYYARNQEFLELIVPLDVMVRKLLVPFLFLMACAAYFYELSYPLLPIGVILIAFMIISEGAFLLIRRGKWPAVNIYFCLLVMDCILTSAAMYYSGGIESFIYVVFGIIGVLAGLTLPLWGVMGVIFMGGIGYSTVLLLESNRILPHFSIFKELAPVGLHLRSDYLIIIPLANFVAFVAVSFMIYSVANILHLRKQRMGELNLELDKSSKLLVRRDLDLNTANQELDRNLTELTDLKSSLEQKVKARTRELEEKVAELEQFNNLTVGRELKMVELENEIDHLLKELGREPRYHGK